MKSCIAKQWLAVAAVAVAFGGMVLAQTTAPTGTATPNGSAALPRPAGVEPDVGIGLTKGAARTPDGRPQFQVPRVAINPNLPTLWIIGDSTVRNGSYEDGGNGQWGWGRPIRYWFDETKINIQNRAVGGTSSKTFQDLHWDWIMQEIKPGDFLIAQFGHNDAGTPRGNDDELHPVAARGGGPRGARGATSGPATQAVAAAPTTQQMVHSFGWYMRKYVTDAKGKGAVWAALCSPIPRNNWREGTIGPDGWTATIQEAAGGSGATFIPLNAMIIERYKALGQEKVTNELFPEREGTHPSWAGAVLNAEIVVEGLKQAKSPLVQYLKPEAPKDLTNPWGKAR